MSKDLRAAVRSIILETMTADAGVNPDLKGVDLNAKCNHCNRAVWLVWSKADPINKWTECGGIGKGSCDETVPPVPDVAPPTQRSVYADPSSGPRLKRSV